MAWIYEHVGRSLPLPRRMLVRVCSYLGRVFDDLLDESSGVPSDEVVRVLQAGEDVREDLGLHHQLRQGQRVLGDVGQRRQDLTLWTGRTEQMLCVCACEFTRVW